MEDEKKKKKEEAARKKQEQEVISTNPFEKCILLTLHSFKLFIFNLCIFW